MGARVFDLRQNFIDVTTWINDCSFFCGIADDERTILLKRGDGNDEHLHGFFLRLFQEQGVHRVVGFIPVTVAECR